MDNSFPFFITKSTSAVKRLIWGFLFLLTFWAHYRSSPQSYQTVFYFTTIFALRDSYGYKNKIFLLSNYSFFSYNLLVLLNQTLFTLLPFSLLGILMGTKIRFFLLSKNLFSHIIY